MQTQVRKNVDKNIRSYYTRNRYSEQTFEGVGIMSWLQKNVYIKILTIVTVFILAYIFITDDGDVSYERITIKEGDTLWTLAERYKGNMSTNEWIRKVAAENNLNGIDIFAGETLMIPIPKDAIYIAINEDGEIQSAKVAINKNEK